MVARNPETARARTIVRGLCLVAVLVALAGVFTWLNPSAPPYTGRLAWVVEAAYWLAGPAGPALLSLSASLCILLMARFVWRHTPKLPSDRVF